MNTNNKRVVKPKPKKAQAVKSLPVRVVLRSVDSGIISGRFEQMVTVSSKKRRLLIVLNNDTMKINIRVLPDFTVVL